MKIIEAMKEIKRNKEKVADLQQKIALHCANLNHETPPYGNETKLKIREWLQSCTDLSQRNVELLTGITRTNMATTVAIAIDGTVVNKTIAQWIWRRREYAAVDLHTYQQLTDRNLREGTAQSSQ